MCGRIDNFIQSLSTFYFVPFDFFAINFIDHRIFRVFDAAGHEAIRSNIGPFIC